MKGLFWLTVGVVWAAQGEEWQKVRKRQDDLRSYQGMVLGNQLKVLLVSDPNASKASLSLVLATGHQDNPQDVLGMAHFCEHMVHLGSVKYPKEDYYLQYINANSGTFSAETHFNHTSFQFTIVPKALEKAMDIFAHLLIEPKLSESSIGREVQAVQNEYNGNLYSWEFKVISVLDSLSNATSPYSRFRAGNSKTLLKGKRNKSVLRDKVKLHHQTYYSANLMSLVLVSPASLEHLANITTPIFTRIPNHNQVGSNIGYPFAATHVDVQINPNLYDQTLALEFIIDTGCNHSLKTGFDFIGYYLTRKDPGYFYASQKGRVTKIIAQLSESLANFSLFHVFITATGPETADDITRDLFAYLKALPTQALTQERYDEYLNMATTRKKVYFAKNGDGLSLALAETLNEGVPFRDVVYNIDPIEEFNLHAIRGTIEMLTQAVMRRGIASHEIEASSVEPWYLAQYDIFKTNSTLLLGLNPDSIQLPNVIHLPKEEYLSAPPHVQLVRNTSTFQFWHIASQEDSLCGIKLSFQNINCTPDEQEITRLTVFVEILKEKLANISDTSSAAGEEVQIAILDNKVEIQIITSHPQHFLSQLLNGIIHLEITQQDLIKAKESFSWTSGFGSNDPEIQLNYLMLAAIAWDILPPAALQTQLDILDFRSFVRWQKTLLAYNFVNLLLVGQNNADSIAQLIDKFQHHPSQCPTHMDNLKPITLSGQNVFQTRSYDPIQILHGVAFYLELYTDKDITNAALSLLTSNLIKIHFYNQLRTKEQLAYSLDSELKVNTQGGGILFRLKSPSHPAHIEARIEAFLEKFVRKMIQMPHRKFAARVRALLHARQTNQPTLTEALDEHWTTITKHNANFHRDKQINNSLRHLTQPHLINFLTTSLLKASPHRKKLSIHILLDDAKAKNCGSRVTDLLRWKKVSLFH
ncbi:hypothetical protein DSO57_1033260 [Entomophthora muscae]|uniref:Uncharacterized protein n=1 Tax=Entomophthora muscae TaxID=34485 RepID=A0ACC2TYT2_9FUNG|nr:hypothetical protein DSO57_1033260 [Entomophthora muscae]